MRVLRRGLATALTALSMRKTNMSTLSPPLTPGRRSGRTPSRSSGKFAPSNIMFLDRSVAAADPEDDMEPKVLQRRVVVYDGVCHLCHSGVKWIIDVDKDKKIKFCCLQSEAAEPYMKFCGLQRKDVLRRILFVEGPGSYHQGSAAVLRVLSYLPLPYSALSALMVIPAPMRDAVYDYVAERRYDWFGKGDDCLVLKETELLERFVDCEELLKRSRSQL